MNTLFFIILAIACVYGAPAGKEIICQPGSVSKLDCNTCICSADGSRLSCTKMTCSTTKYFNEDGTLKKPGEVLNNPLLRNKRDIKSTKPGKPVYIFETSCTPGKQFYNECNTCTCNVDGQSAGCTLMYCL